MSTESTTLANPSCPRPQFGRKIVLTDHFVLRLDGSRKPGSSNSSKRFTPSPNATDARGRIAPVHPSADPLQLPPSSAVLLDPWPPAEEPAPADTITNPETSSPIPVSAKGGAR